jgi:zinc ribbon protein
MNCPRCNTELPDSAIFCVKCGSTMRPASFSYLPAGVPDWPTNVPQNLPYSTGSDVRPAQFVQQEESPPVAKSAVAAKKSRLGMPAVIGLFILSILIGGGLTFGVLYANGQQLSFGPQPTQPPVQLPTPGPSSTSGPSTPSTQGTQLPTPTAFQTITSTDLGISLKYPSDWQKTGPATTQSSNIEISLRPQQQLGMEVRIRRFSTSNSASITSTSSANQANLTAFSQFTGVTNLQPTTSSQPTIGGVQWDEQDAKFTGPNNVQYDFVTLAVKHNNLYFMMFLYSPDMFYKEAAQKYFQPMFDSFKFLS